ncbi:hypothetical protein [Neoroseomonas oryzicola]|uniref:Uncharacterized protein n=1 Tax=Neoroseomonas oryzicola TaxID=535904 RepID=A0A9X9WLI2_9PROT|nr:hypothetical protein [Neoroseomonas oryzicola]MBR0661192.1 hypothetical protein [Neoroseomonas oryzicola]NKE17557.1 hypothetical protein [Neoroseomonas oryzicola]
MCEPISTSGALSYAALAVGAASAVGGAYMQQRGQQQASDDAAAARTRAASAARIEAEWQDQFAAQRRAAAADAVSAVTPGQIQQHMDRAAAERTALPVLPTDGMDPNQDLLGGQAGASATARNMLSERATATREKLTREAQARAELSSWGDAFQRAGEAAQPARERLDMFGDFAGGRAGVSGLETNAYGMTNPAAGAAARAIGSGLSGVGNAAMSNAGSIGSYSAAPQAR